MNIVSLEEVKDYLNIDDFYKDEDKFLINILNIAESAVLGATNGSFCDSELLEVPEQSNLNYRNRLKGAVLMLVSTLYNEREMTTSSNIKESPIWNMIICPLTKFDSF